MRWRTGRRSGNIEDRRGRGGLMIGGGLGGLVLVVAALLLGIDPREVTQLAPTANGGGPPPADDERAQFVAVVLGDTEDAWNALFAEQGLDYREPTLVLFEGAVQSACGMAQSAVGPFYCPADHRLYIDLGFYDDLRERLGAPGDFAQAYVIAHEVGHHVQTLLGLTDQVAAARQSGSAEEANEASVRFELQADCLAGVWAHHAQRARDIIEPGDVEEALGAAAAIGDDNLQRQTQGYVVPESFTHGTSAQRVRWWRTGFERGDVAGCDTFGVARV
ncbi:MAG: KPN_02809 family neutral zinc metallopeptidase [Longimicrobiales bacterium]